MATPDIVLLSLGYGLEPLWGSSDQLSVASASTK